MKRDIYSKVIIFKMSKKEVLAALLDSKKVGVLKVLLNSNDELYLNEIAKKSGVSIASTFRLLQNFVDLDLIEKKVWKTSKVYSCKKNEKVTFLKDLFTEEFDGVKEFLELSNNIKGVNEILLTKKSKNNAYLILIGDTINESEVKDICKNIKNKGYEINFVTLTKEKYEQMVNMGLYSGDKTILRP